MSLKEKLSSWKDWDFAAFELGVLLGVFKEDSYLKVKGILWTIDSDHLYFILDEMVELGILEHRNEPDSQYKWNEDHALSKL